jgi:hypothetical protein
MRLEQGQQWRCINQACGAEIQVMECAGLASGSNPRCSCGSIMKMPYKKPQLRRFEATEDVKRLLRPRFFRTIFGTTKVVPSRRGFMRQL